MKKEINIFDYANDIMTALGKGVLLTTQAEGTVNSMTIGWGMLGIEWDKPVFVALVRKGRFTKELLDKNPVFTVNIPYGKTNRKAIGFCGTNSGRNVDKIKKTGLNLEEASVVDVPVVKDYPLTLECKVIYQQEQNEDKIPDEDKKIFYPQDIDSSNTGANKDFHILYHAEIVKAYIIED